MRSPMITHGAWVLPVVTLGMIEPSAMRRFFTEIVPTHLGGAGRVMHRHRPVPDQVVERLARQGARQDLALDEGLHRLGVAEVAGDLHARAQGREVARIAQHVGVNLRRLMWISRL